MKKKLRNEEASYASPTIELIEVAIEQGFINSPTTDFAPAGTLEEDESDSYYL